MKKGWQVAPIMSAATAPVVASIATTEAAGTFGRWIGSPAGWVSNNAEAASLAKRVERFRAILPGHAEPVESGSAGSEVWIHLRCRARNPAEAPTAWIDLADHPAQLPALELRYRPAAGAIVRGSGCRVANPLE